MDFSGLLPVLKKRVAEPQAPIVYVKDNLHLSTWLCIGAVVQSAAFLLVGRLALLPATLFLVYRMVDTYAMTIGLKHNAHMDGVIKEKFSAQFPDAQGNYGNKASNSDVAVLIIGSQSNHPMGLFAPGFKDLGDYFTGMTKHLQEHAVENGFLGSNSYIGAQRSSNNQVMTIMYFKNTDYVHAFADGPLHREGWNWWNKIVATHPHLTIFHELYQVPKGYWESIYQQSLPFGAAGTSHRIQAKGDLEGGIVEDRWMSPIVDAQKGVLKSSAGRMGKNLGEKE